MTGEDRTDTEDRLERLATGIAASKPAQLGFDQSELLVERDDQRQHHLDLSAHPGVELERGHPAAPLRSEQAAAAARPPLMRKQPLRPSRTAVDKRFAQPRLVAQQ